MADTATTNSAPVDGDKAHKARPEKPDEEKFKADVSKAEKELSAAQERLVCSGISRAGSPPRTFVLTTAHYFPLPLPTDHIMRVILIYMSRMPSRQNSTSPSLTTRNHLLQRSSRNSGLSSHLSASSNLASKLLAAVLKRSWLRSTLNSNHELLSRRPHEARLLSRVWMRSTMKSSAWKSRWTLER